MGEIKKLKTDESMRPVPKRIIRPCEWGLRSAIADMETQLGSIEAYNMLTDYAAQLKAEIDAGNAKPQNEYFSTHPRNVE